MVSVAKWFKKGMVVAAAAAMGLVSNGHAQSKPEKFKIGGVLSQLQRHDIDARSFDGLLATPSALEQALRYASACGALAVTRHGAFASLPTHDETVSLLSRTQPPEHWSRA